MPKFFDVSIEKKVLVELIHSDDTMESAAASVLESDFTDENTTFLFSIILRFYRKYYQRITRDIISSWLAQNDPKRKTQILLLFTELEALESDGYGRYYINELKSYTKKRQLHKIHETVTGGLNDDTDPDTLFSQLSQEILTGGHDSLVYRTSIFDNIDERLRLFDDRKNFPEKYQGVPYGITEIDEVTGGIYAGHLYMIMGRTGAGKSRMLFNIGCNVAKAGKSVMYCTIEMEAAIIQNMWESREAQIPLQNIMRAKMSSVDETRYKQFLRNSANTKIPFYIVDIPQGCTTGMIDAEVVMHEKVHGKPPDLVLIDYANLISPISKFKDRAEKFDHVFRELKEGARAHKTVYYTAAQMNRESTKVKDPGTEHVAFSDAASYHCDAIFRVFADKGDEATEDLLFEVIKGRFHAMACVTLLWKRDINLIASFGTAKVGKSDVPKDQSVVESAPADADVDAEY